MLPWSTLTWILREVPGIHMNGRRVRAYFCNRCKRHFVEIIGTGERFAAYASIFDFEPLQKGDSISQGL